MSDKTGWIGVDLDGTLAFYDDWKSTQHIGDPIQEMVNRVRGWLLQGVTVKIFTARVHGHGMPLIGGGTEDAITPIQNWCLKHLGIILEITNVKDFGMIELWDDRAVQVAMNEGLPIGRMPDVVSELSVAALITERDQLQEDKINLMNKVLDAVQNGLAAAAVLAEEGDRLKAICKELLGHVESEYQTADWSGPVSELCERARKAIEMGKGKPKEGDGVGNGKE